MCGAFLAELELNMHLDLQSFNSGEKLVELEVNCREK
jgi:hypothetical protein